MPARAPTAGVRTAWPASATWSSACASVWRCGTVATRSSRSACSVSPAPRRNHGEDVKEHWWYLDAIPSHAWNRWRYHYPQRAFPYADLLAENGRRGKFDPEYELLDTGVFDDDRYWICEVDYAKADPTIC